MAGNLMAIDTTSGGIVGAWALGLAAEVKGVCSDGLFFWVTDDTWLYQLYQKSDGTFSIVSFNKLSASLPDVTSLGPIETDGYNLFVAYTGASGFPISAFGAIAKVSKDFKVLNPSWGPAMGAVASVVKDLCWVGSELWYIKDTNLASPNNFKFAIVDPNGIEVFSKNQRANYHALAFDGVNFPCIDGRYNYSMIDTAQKVLLAGIGLGITSASAGCCKRNNHLTGCAISEGIGFQPGVESNLLYIGYT